MSYQALIHIDKIDFSRKRVIIIGAGWMADQYCQALTAMNISSVVVVSRKEESSRQCCERYGYQPRYGGYRDVLPKLAGADLVIVATPVHELRSAAEFAVSLGYKTILVEKPGALYSEDLLDWMRKVEKQDVRIRVAFNRQTYPSFWKLRELADSEGGMTSCHYTFTEWIHTINFHNNREDVYTRWGIANSLHVIAMAHALIGMPKSIDTYRSGELPWHPVGERFTGAGVTKQGVLFSYHADWNSAGRWGIEVMTSKNAYRLIPLEQIYKCEKGKLNWELVEITAAFPKAKEGICEEIAIMIHPDLEKTLPLVMLDRAAEYTRLCEQIFGYR